MMVRKSKHARSKAPAEVDGRIEALAALVLCGPEAEDLHATFDRQYIFLGGALGSVTHITIAGDPRIRDEHLAAALDTPGDATSWDRALQCVGGSRDAALHQVEAEFCHALRASPSELPLIALFARPSMSMSQSADHGDLSELVLAKKSLGPLLRAMSLDGNAFWSAVSCVFESSRIQPMLDEVNSKRMCVKECAASLLDDLLAQLGDSQGRAPSRLSRRMHAIVKVLQDARGERLVTRQIADRLKPPTSAQSIGKDLTTLLSLGIVENVRRRGYLLTEHGMAVPPWRDGARNS